MKSLHHRPLLLSSLFLLLVTIVIGADPAPKAIDTAALKVELAKTEDAFCALAKEKGLLAAFEYYAAPDVAFIDTDPRRVLGWPPCNSVCARPRPAGRLPDLVGPVHGCFRRRHPGI